MSLKFNTVFHGLLAAGLVTVPFTGIHAQELKDSEQHKGLEVIEVTSQKRVQSIQDVALSVAAVTGDFIEDNNIPRLDGLSEFVPNLTISDGFTGQTISIRGIGTAQGNAGFEQSVPTFVDGLFNGRSMQSLTPFLDIERVEVLRGPQPAYFGQNAIGGALNISTKKPQMDVLTGFARATVANNSELVFEGAVDTSLSDTVGLRIAGRWSDKDGPIKNSFTGDDMGGTGQEAIRAQLRFEPSEDLSFNLKVESASQTQHGTNSQVVDCDPDNSLLGAIPTACGLAGTLFGDSVEYEQDSQNNEGGVLSIQGQEANAHEFRLNEDEVDNELYQLDIEYSFDDIMFNSTTGFSSYDSIRYRDLDGTPLSMLSAFLLEDYEQFSQELRLTSTGTGALEWMTGLYYQSSEINSQNQTLTAFAGPSGTATGVKFNDESTWLSAFAAFTYHVSETFRLNAALRYSDVQKDAKSNTTAASTDPLGVMADQYLTSGFSSINGDAQCNDNFEFGVCIKDNYDTDAISYSVSAQWDIAKSTMIYASIADGFKSGGFNAGRSVPASVPEYTYEDEKAKAYEIGYKTRALDNNLVFNIAAFYTEYDNLQVSSFDVLANAFNVGNAAQATTQGLELDTQYRLNDNLTLNASLALLDATYDAYPGAQCSQLEIQEAENGCSVTQSTTDRSGEELLNSPEYSGSIGFVHETELGNDLLLTVNGNMYFTDEYQVSDRYDPRGIVDGYTSSSLNIRLENLEKLWEVSAYVRDIEDKENKILFGPSQFNGAASGFAITEAGITYGLQLGMRF